MQKVNFPAGGDGKLEPSEPLVSLSCIYKLYTSAFGLLTHGAALKPVCEAVLQQEAWLFGVELERHRESSREHCRSLLVERWSRTGLAPFCNKIRSDPGFVYDILTYF
jgi:hypothetical protein